MFLAKSIQRLVKPIRTPFVIGWNLEQKVLAGLEAHNIKFGIYCDKKTQNYIYDKGKYDSSGKAIDAIKSQITSILEAGKQFEIEKDWKVFAQTLEGEFDIQRHVRSKILSIYYPSEFLQMHGNEDAHHILESLFGVPKKPCMNCL